MLAALLAVLSLCAEAQAQTQAFSSFSELRHAVLDRISGSTKRIWLVTDYLTDGETVTALYLAQYRKLDVKVLLGRAKANAYMSRLNYLKSQSIPVFLKPDHFRAGSPTAILTDDTLVRIDGELDFLAKYKRFNLSTGSAAEAQAFATAFADAAKMGVPAVPHPIPLVGRPHRGGHVYSPTGAAGAGPAHYSVTDGAYVYGGRSPPRPDGVAGKLPRELKSERRALEAEEREKQAKARGGKGRPPRTRTKTGTGPTRQRSATPPPRHRRRRAAKRTDTARWAQEWRQGCGSPGS
jgi:hypothetical protein